MSQSVLINYQNSLEDSSSLIKTLMQSEESSFLIYPREIQEKIKKQIEILK